jgi:hypothetical protein
MRHLGPAAITIAFVFAGGTSVAQEIPAAAADCTFRLEQMHGHDQDIWRTLSARAEALAPTPEAVTTAPGRHRAVRPPSGPGALYSSVNYIDDEIFGKMVRDGVKWTGPSTDAEFLRRVTLDLTGEIPTPEAVKAFLADSSANKREKVIDQLLASEPFNDRWTMWLGDLVQNVSAASNTNVGNVGRDAYFRFLRDSLHNAKPYDWIVRQLLSGVGDASSHGEVNYWMRDVQNNGPIQDTYDNLSASSSARFLGVTTLCLSCHSGFAHLEQVNSSLAKRTRDEFWANAAFFAQVTTGRVLDPQSGQQVATLSDNLTGAYRLNTTSGNKTPRQPVNGGANVADPAFILGGEKPAPGEVRRAAYARILTAHPQFARATVNYLWKELFGLGIVEPANNHDLLRQDPATLAKGAVLQPTHPALLTKLANDFAVGGYDLRAILKRMAMSNAYQLSSRYTGGTWNETMTPYFARHYPHRLMAEELLDATFRATGISADLNVGALGVVQKAMQLPDTTGGGGYGNFLNAFGRGNRDDESRSEDSSAIQALMLLNDPIMVTRTRNVTRGSTVQKTLAATKDAGTIVDTLYLTTLGRYPTPNERADAVQRLGTGDLTRNTEDLQFVLLNKLEFLFN